MPDKRITVTAEGFEVDAAMIAAAFGLDPVGLQERMRAGDIVSLCERGEGADAGRFRLTFRHAGRVLRLTLDGEGKILSRAIFDAPRQASHPSPRRGA